VVATGVPEVLSIGGVGLPSGVRVVEEREHEVLAAAMLGVEAEEHPAADDALSEAYSRGRCKQERFTTS
jgi:hypothetical protein